MPKPNSNSEANANAEEFARKLLDVFDQFPHVQFIWKYGTDKENYQQLGKHNNVHAKAWLEQPAILGKLSFFFIERHMVQPKIEDRSKCESNLISLRESIKLYIKHSIAHKNQ